MSIFRKLAEFFIYKRSSLIVEAVCCDIFEIFGSWSFFLRGFAMSTRGGRRIGSGRKKEFMIAAPLNVKFGFRVRGHTRIWLDNVIYSSWISGKSLCGHSSDSKFAGHLLSLEQRRG